jgi:hypothetical protein
VRTEGEGVVKNTDGACITVAKSITSLCFTTTKRIYRIKTSLLVYIYMFYNAKLTGILLLITNGGDDVINK